MIVKHRGHEIVQADNNHIGIVKDGQGIAHIHGEKHLNKEELKQMVDWLIEFAQKNVAIN